MIEILVGTGNRHKAEEIAKLLSDLPVKVKTLKDFPAIAEVVEDGKTLEDNAVKKARSYAQASGLLTLADDTGLEVKALNGGPGVLSARYAGETCSYEDNNRKLLKNLESSKDRAARFRCVIAICDPRSNVFETVEGVVEGEILRSARGRNGFGYDPIFYLPGQKKTFAELALEEKNRVSHRALALQKAKRMLSKKLKMVSA